MPTNDASMALSPDVSVSKAKRLAWVRVSTNAFMPASSSTKLYVTLSVSSAPRVEAAGATSMAASNMLNCPSLSWLLETGRGVGFAEAAGAAAVVTSPKILRDKVRNSNSSRTGASTSALAGSNAMAGKSSSKSMSNTMVANSLLRNARSRFASTFSFIFPLSS